MSWTEWTELYFRGLNLNDLEVDQAFFNISSAMDIHLYLYSLSEECIKCPFKRLRTVAPHSETVFALNVARNREMKLVDRDFGNYLFSNLEADGIIWTDHPKMGQFGVYDLQIKESGTVSFEVAKEPVNIYFCKLIH